MNNLLDHRFDFSAAIMIQSSSVTLKLAPMTLEYVPTQNSPWGLNLSIMCLGGMHPNPSSESLPRNV